MTAKFRAGKDQSAVLENVETLTGQRGDGRNRAVTYGDLSTLGLANLRQLGGGKVTLTPGNGSGGSNSGGGVQKPTKPTNFKATGGFAYVLLEWDMPNYRGRSLTEIYRSPEDNLANAVLIASSAAGVYGDPVDPDWKGYYWIRHVNALGEPGAFNDSKGTYAQTHPDPAAIIEVIKEQLNTSPLIADLTEKLETNTKNIGTVDSNVKTLSESVSNQNSAMAKRVTDVETSSQTNASAVRELSQSVSEQFSSSAERVEKVEAATRENNAAVQTNAKAITEMDKNGSASYRAMWSAKAQAGDVTAGIGIVAGQDSSGNTISQVAVSANQFFIFDPNNPNDKTTYAIPFAVVDGKVVIDELIAKDAVIKILSAQTIIADSVKAGIEIVSPYIKTARIESGNFTVDQNGNMTAKNAKIEGEITATSGSFTGTVNAKDGVFRGTVYATDGEFSGTVYANKIVGDVVKPIIHTIGSTTIIPAEPFIRRIFSSPVVLATNANNGGVNIYFDGNNVMSASGGGGRNNNSMAIGVISANEEFKITSDRWGDSPPQVVFTVMKF
ncbi:phage tail tip fiber protein [Pectobacterium carotovorum]|uniref:phage tail tip fiber protein n=1 Tax=Pectobacterium carotovorum TaxID=554 RepID=UPI00301742FB